MIQRMNKQKGLGTTGILILFLIFIGIGGAFYWLVLRPVDRPMTVTVDESESTTVSDTDTQTVQYEQTIILPGSPIGLAWDGSGFLAANRDSTMGFIRVSRNSAGVTQTELVPMVDSKTGQSMAFPGVAWNGTNFISMAARRSRLAGREEIFTLHDPGNLAILKEFVAPAGIGCIAWDGTRYWAGTHLELGSASPSGTLYQLDKEFNVVAQYEVPMKGCRGLAWDGYRLLWADDMTNSLNLISLASDKPEVVHSYQTAAAGLTGVAYDGNNIWIAESGKKEIRQLDPRLQKQWLIGDYSIKGASQLASLDEAAGRGVESEEVTLTRPLTRPSIGTAQVDQIIDSLIEEQGAARTRELLEFIMPKLLNDEVLKQVRARYNKLQDFGGFSYKDDRVLAPEDIHFTYLNVRLENGQMIGSWEVRAGDTIAEGIGAPAPSDISNPLQPGIRYTIFIESDKSAEPITRDFEITESPDTQDNYVLLDGLENGTTYTVRATMSAAYYVNGKGHTFTSSVNPYVIKY